VAQKQRKVALEGESMRKKMKKKKRKRVDWKRKIKKLKKGLIR